MWSIFQVHNEDEGLETHILIWIGDSFNGTLPGDIDGITVTGPNGPLPYDISDFIYETFANPPQQGLYGLFRLVLSGPPTPGMYSVHVTSGNMSGGGDIDVQGANKTLPVPGKDSFTPSEGALITSKTPSFTWEAIDYDDAPIYYQLLIRDVSGNWIYFSPREKGMLAWTLPLGILSPGETYYWQVAANDDSDFKRMQNRSCGPWHTFTMANTLLHNAIPAIDGGSTLGAITWTSSSTDLLLWASVIDHDGVASDGSSHILQATLPNGTVVNMTANTMNRKAYLKDEKQIRTATRVFYSGYVSMNGNPVPAGDYTFTVTDPDGNVGTMVDTLEVNPLDAPAVNTIFPSCMDDEIAAWFDNVYVNGQPFDDFESYAAIGDLDPAKWSGPSGIGNMSIENGRVKMTQAGLVSPGTFGLNLRDPSSANAIQADITVGVATSDAVQARIYGFFYNNGNGDVYADIKVRNNRVTYNVVEFTVGDSYTIRVLESGELMTVSQSQTVTVSIQWDWNTLTFGADGNTAAFTPGGPIYIPTRFTSKHIGIRTSLNLPDTTPTFTFDPVPGANIYSIRVYDGWNDYVIGNVYGGNSPILEIPPGMLEPNTAYKFEFRVTDAHDSLNVSNYALTPVQFEMITGEESVYPSIELDSTGVRTENQPVLGPHLMFWIRVNDAQGVPGNIRSVKVIFPDGLTQETLYYAEGKPYDDWDTRTSGYYYRNSYLPIAAGTYTFVVEDRDGHIASRTKELIPDPVGYPAWGSLPPTHVTLGTASATLDWEDIPGAVFYRLEIYEKDFERVYALGTTDSRYDLPPGFLKDGTLYRYLLKSYREFFDEIADNGSSSAIGLSLMPTFFTEGRYGGTAQPSIDHANEGVSVYHLANPNTGEDVYALSFLAGVTDEDGVPENIREVKVTYPDGVTTRSLIFRGRPFGGGDIYYDRDRYFNSELYADYTLIPLGTYTFTVTDFDGRTAQFTDDLTVENLNPLPLVTGLSPAEDEAAGVAPLFTWDPVSGANLYQVSICDALGRIEFFKSDFLSEAQYQSPDGVLEANKSYSYRILAYRETLNDPTVVNASTQWKATVFTTGTPVQAGLCGDVNENNRVDIGDAMFIAQYLVGNRLASELNLAVGDTNVNGRVDIGDAMFIAQWLVGNRDCLCLGTAMEKCAD